MAAAMALSMSAVAFAKDNNQTNNPGIGAGLGEVNDGTGADAPSYGDKTLVIGVSRTYEIEPGKVTTEVNNVKKEIDISSEVLADLIQANLVAIDVSATAGKNNLSSMPKVTAKADGTGTNYANATMSVKFKDTWGVDEVSSTMRIRITAKTDIGYDTANETLGKYDSTGIYNNRWLPKGDTITLKPFTLKANYNKVTAYGENMTLTPSEHDARNILAEGSELYDNADSSDKVIIYFKDKRDRDVAAYEAKISPNQKDVNLGYDVDAIDAVVEEHPDVDFEFINFKAQTSGKNRFQNSGTLYFNAIGEGNTAVYEVVDNTLVKLDAKYDSDDKTVYVSGIRELTQYVVASEELPEEEPEEESSSSEAPEAPAETPAGNPSTGAL